MKKVKENCEYKLLPASLHCQFHCWGWALWNCKWKTPCAIFILRVQFYWPWQSLFVQAPDSGLCSVGDINWLTFYLNEAKNSKWVVATKYTSNRKWPFQSIVPSITYRWMYSKYFLMIAVLRKIVLLRERVGLCWQGHEAYKWEKLSGLWIFMKAYTAWAVVSLNFSCLSLTPEAKHTVFL